MKVFSLVCLLAVVPVAVSAAQTKPKAAGTQAKSSKGARTVELTGGDTM